MSIDPGSKDAGVAVWKKGTLRIAFLACGKSWEETALGIKDRLNDELLWPTSAVFEIPEIYMPRYSKGDPNVCVVPLILQIGALIDAFGLLTTHRTVKPKEWKKQTPKPIMTRRIRERLSEQERNRIELPNRKSLHHNVWDGIGIGLYHLGRLTRRRAA